MEVPVACSPGARLSFSWGLGTELRLIELQPPSAPLANQPAVRTTLIWSTTSASHKAVAAAIAPQAAKLYAPDPQRTDNRPSLSSFSLSVREQLLKRSASTDAPEGRDLALEATMWALIELLFNSLPASEGYFAEELAAWAADHSATLDLEAGVQPGLDERLEALLASTSPATQHDFWPCLTHLVRLGRLSSAMSLLMAHDALQQPCYEDGSLPAGIKEQFELLEALFILLRRMPRYRHVYTPLSRGATSEAGAGQQFDTMSQYLEHRAGWQRQCRELPGQYADVVEAVNRVNPTTAQGVLGVLEVLCSSETAVLGHCHTWLEAAVAVLVHMRPQLQLRPHMTALLASSCQAVALEAQQPVLRLIHDVVQAAAAGEVQEVITVLSSSGLMSTWFMCYVYDLLTAADHRAAAPLMHHLPETVGGNQVEYFRLLLAETLMPLPGGVQHLHLAAGPALPVLLPATWQRGSRGAAGGTAGGQQVRRDAAATQGVCCCPTARSGHHCSRDHTCGCGRCVVHRAGGRCGAAAGGHGGAADAVRSRLVLEPLDTCLADKLNTLDADYRATELPLMVSDESPAVIRALAGPEAGQGVQGQSWLHAYVSTTQALATLQTSLTAAAQQTGAEAQAALVNAAKAFLQALLQLLGREGSSPAVDAPSMPTLAPVPASKQVGGPPPGLLPALLSRVIPALQLPAVTEAAKDSSVAGLLSAASTALSVCQQSAEQGLAGSRVAAMSRCMQDVQMCLAQLSCRAYVQACEPGY